MFIHIYIFEDICYILVNKKPFYRLFFFCKSKNRFTIFFVSNTQKQTSMVYFIYIGFSRAGIKICTQSENLRTIYKQHFSVSFFLKGLSAKIISIMFHTICSYIFIIFLTEFYT